MNMKSTSTGRKQLKLQLFTAIMGLSFLFCPSLGGASEIRLTQDTPALLISDNLLRNDRNNTLIAEGKVYLSHDDQLLYADKVRYDQQSDTIYAEGNVWFRDKNGTFAFSDRVELKNKFNDGFVSNIKMLMVDDSRLAALKAQRFKGKKTVLWKGVYSPCRVCKQQPDSIPLWQLRASKIIHDSEAKELIYHNLFMDFLGLPVFYLPYFFHPDPSVKRKTGLLAPTLGTSGDFGFIFSQPFFWNINPNSDLTIYPTYTTKEGMIVGAEYRHLYTAAEMRINTSFTANSHNHDAQMNNPNTLRIPGKNRWHAFLDARVEVTPDVLLTAKIRRASDLTYLRRYPISIGNTSPLEIQTSLTSTLAMERFKDTSYGIVRAYVFQDDNIKTTPYIYPIIDYNFETKPGGFGESYGFNVNLINLSRQQGITGHYARKMTRGSLDLYGQIPYISKWGDVWQLKAAIRGDIYAIDDYQPTAADSPYSGTKRRLFPQASLSWRYPFFKILENYQWVLEPSFMLVGGARSENSVGIPNEDAPFVILDTTNLYQMNRFYGIDQVDTGYRAVYGVHSRHYLKGQKHIFLFLGQSKRLDHKTALPLSSGESNSGSGIIGKIDFKPHKLIDLQSRFMLNRSNLGVDSAESAMRLDLNYLSVNVGHVYHSSTFSISGRESSQMNWSISTAKYKDLTLNYSETRNLKAGKNDIKVLSRGIVLTHQNECLTTSLSVVHLGYKDRDIRPDTRVMLQLTFKNLGTMTPVKMDGYSNL